MEGYELRTERVRILVKRLDAKPGAGGEWVVRLKCSTMVLAERPLEPVMDTETAQNRSRQIAKELCREGGVEDESLDRAEWRPLQPSVFEKEWGECLVRQSH